MHFNYKMKLQFLQKSHDFMKYESDIGKQFKDYPKPHTKKILEELTYERAKEEGH